MLLDSFLFGLSKVFASAESGVYADQYLVIVQYRFKHSFEITFIFVRLLLAIVVILTPMMGIRLVLGGDYRGSSGAGLTPRAAVLPAQ